MSASTGDMTGCMSDLGKFKFLKNSFSREDIAVLLIELNLIVDLPQFLTDGGV